MELPPELLAIVREYAKPVFAHWKVFNEATRVFERRHLEPLRDALIANGVEVSETLKMYLTYVHDLNYCEDNLLTYKVSRDNFHDDKQIKKNLTIALINAQLKESSQYREVMLSIYGPKSALDYDTDKD